MSAHETIKGPTTNASDQAAAAAIRERAAVSGKTISPDAGEDADLFGKIATEAYNTIPGVEFDGGAFDWGVDNSFKQAVRTD
ncbi:hypothetical protein Pmar_PMAR022505 [Perkinsus marinus ATCC 50983]|uniref:Uncharacterized protein n=1 Tax=Perkinsus marinus (strain ATCC 50983 / TXsc) TaxID=423536 RepID=C5KNF7_PERM5|nr:hypothetical protein Pmar_PMAR022505 [Perkinsus marinus ATCC 50983]EER13972.1 hypothetical protein Pmar_PMAR022505 [Perkinsus marinus ATCC 50983]|eukprot:XP_002782177.1 hypothetical protein Pmar_PMAR022505 [Perkinsus marinus ATCC 50983]